MFDFCLSIPIGMFLYDARAQELYVLILRIVMIYTSNVLLFCKCSIALCVFCDQGQERRCTSRECWLVTPDMKTWV